MNSEENSSEPRSKGIDILRQFDEETHELLKRLVESSEHISKRQDRITIYGAGATSVIVLLFLVFGTLFSSAIGKIATTVNNQAVILNRIDRAERDISELDIEIRQINSIISVPAWGGKRNPSSNLQQAPEDEEN